MEPTERIEVRNIYIKNATIFGILYGLVVGFIAGIFVLISSLLLPEGVRIFGNLYGTSIGSIFAGAGITFLSFTIGIFILVLIGSLVYNFVSRIGGRMNIGLAEYSAPLSRMMR